MKSSLSFFVAAGAGTAAFGFYDGLWVPLLRDGQTAAEAELVEGFLVAGGVAERLAKEEVVVLDGVLSTQQLHELQEELRSLAVRPGAMQPNPKMKAGNMEIRTDRVCYLRDPESFMASETGPPLGGPALQSCHRRLRATAAQLERGGSRKFIVPAWTQLAHYSEGSGFYKWHTDGLEGDWSGFLGWYYWLQRGAVRRRSVTGILYLNDEEWPAAAGGALRYRTEDQVVEILPRGGRLVLFDSHKVEHEVVATRRDRWALTAWFHE